MSNIRYEEVPDLSIVAVVAQAPPPPPLPQTAPPPIVAQTIPQPGTPLVDTEPGVFIPAPPIVQPTAPAPTVNKTIAPDVTAPPADDGSGTVSRQGEPIPQPGTPLVDTAPGVFVPAPEVTPTDSGTPNQTPSDAPDADFPDLEGLDFFGNPPLSGAGFVQYVRRGCQSRNLDDLAVFANAMAEGLGGGMGDSGTSFGPWNMHQQGALPKKYWTYPAFSPLVQAWTWSSGGIDYALDQMVKAGAAGLRGHAAVHRIVEFFERPANIGGQEVIRDDYYDVLAKMGDPYSYLAARAAGPSVDVTPVTPAGGGTSKGGVGAVGFWRTLMDVFWKEIPKTRVKVEAQRDSMKEVFK